MSDELVSGEVGAEGSVAVGWDVTPGGGIELMGNVATGGAMFSLKIGISFEELAEMMDRARIVRDIEKGAGGRFGNR